MHNESNIKKLTYLTHTPDGQKMKPRCENYHQITTHRISCKKKMIDLKTTQNLWTILKSYTNMINGQVN